MADKKDYYDTLKLPREASDTEIKKAYKKLAMKHHPDRNNGDPESTETFKEVKKAYDILSDPQKKSVYDQYGHAGIDQSMGGAGAGAGDAAMLLVIYLVIYLAAVEDKIIGPMFIVVLT